MNNRVELEYLSRVELTQDVTYEFELYWLKRPGMYLVEGDLARRLATVRVRAAVRLEGDFRLIKSIDANGHLRLRVCTGNRRSKIGVHVFPALPPGHQDPVLPEVLGLTSLRDAIYREAARIVQRRYAEILKDSEGLSPLLDYSFSSGDAGLESWMCAIEGNLTRANGDATERRHDLLGEHSSRFQLQIHMPFLSRKETRNPKAALANALVESRGKHINVRRPNDELLEHHLTAAALLAQSEPDKHPFAIWMRAPGPKSALYGPAYHAVARAVQTVLRQHLPQIWEQSSARAFSPLEADTVSVYHESRPWLGRTRTDFSYDCWCPTAMKLFFRSARMTSAGTVLQPVLKRPKYLISILAAERQMINSLINLGIRCHGITNLHAMDPAEATRQISIFAKPWAKSFRTALKGVLPGLDCSSLAPALLAEATGALSESLTPNDYLSAIFPAA
jgi:hypothetical protein